MRRRSIVQTAAVLTAGLVIMSTVGCSNRWVATPANDDIGGYVAPGFGFGTMRGQTLAVGGVVLYRGVRLDEFCAVDVPPRDLTVSIQADLWTPLLVEAATRLAPEVEIIGWAPVLTQVPERLREETYIDLATRTSIQPKLLNEWSAALGRANYFMLGRIENTWPDATGQSDWTLGAGTRGRVAVVTLEVYDLKSGQAVWTRQLQRHVTIGAPRGEDDRDARNVPDDGPRRDTSGVVSQGTTTHVPPLADALTQTFRALVGKLRGA